MPPLGTYRALNVVLPRISAHKHSRDVRICSDVHTGVLSGIQDALMCTVCHSVADPKERKYPVLDLPAL